MIEDPVIMCGSPEHDSAVRLAALAIFLYPVRSLAETYVPGASAMYVRGTCTSLRRAVLYVPEAQGRLPRVPTYCTYGLRVPASCVPHAPEAQGSFPP